MKDFLECLFSCDLERLKKFLKKININAEIPETEGCTILHLLAGIDTLNSKENMLMYLFENGADPNARSYENLTPVHIAAMWNKHYELDLLLQHGGNPWLTDIENKNAFDMAADNYCYEAYQLLNIYHSEDKLNFKIERKKSLEPITSTPMNIMKSLRDSDTECKNPSAYYSFMTANENFPLIFSSTDESEDYSSDVSRFLKRKSLAKHTNRKTNIEDKNVSNASIIRQESVACTQKKNLNDLIEDTNDQMQLLSKNINDTHFFSTRSSDVSETSSSVLNDSSDSTYGTILDSDNCSGIILIESKNNDNLSSSSHISNGENDWKSYWNKSSSCCTLSYCSSHSKLSHIIPNDLQEYSNSKIFQELKNLGDNPGPVLDHTRQVYLLRLSKLKSGCIETCDLPKPKYYPEIYLFLDNKLDMDRAFYLERSMAQEFDAESAKKWREGNQRCCFNYFLLDPRVTQNLPQRASNMTNEQAFLTFLDALFYVGKGTKGRPYSHLFEAAKACNDSSPKSDKVTHILDIWNAGLGVVSLHCFHNSIPVEAYTQEACIIEAIGLENLTNVKKGDFYGLCAKLTSSRKRMIGISLLNKAFQIYLLEGERLIRPKDIQHR